MKKIRNNHRTGIRPRSEGQIRYAEAIRDNLITICQGPAGTGKTLISIWSAIDALRKGDISKIVVLRSNTPALDEDIGFLPGDKESKMHPFLKPLLEEASKVCTSKKELEELRRDEVFVHVPFAYLRGRTFNNSFIICDESQNCTVKHFELLIDRAGRESKIVISGDYNQKDKHVSDFEKLLQWEHPKVGIVRLDESDNQRNPDIASLKPSFRKAMYG